MEMVEKTGVCRFCGQNKLVEVPDSFTQDEIDEEASTECWCMDAKAYKERKEYQAMVEQAKTSAKGTTLQLFHEDHPDIEEVLNYAMNPLVDKKFKKITIATGGKTTAKMSFSNGSIKVEREDKTKNALETDI